MRNDNVVITISKLPPIWPTAEHLGKPDPTWYCGAYQMHEGLLADGIDVRIDDLYLTSWHRDGLPFLHDPSDHSHTLPMDIPLLMGWHGVDTAMYFRSSWGLFPTALASLERGHPLVVQIYATRGHHGLHWVGIWGYGARRQVFLVYDSQYPTKVGGVGNAQYSPEFLQSRLPLNVFWAVELKI
jgi:hypothetical protein